MELAIVLPLLVVLVFGTIAFSIAFNRVQALNAAAREGARVASLSTSTATDVDERVRAALAGVPFDDPPEVSIDPAPCEGRSGQAVVVQVRASTRLEIPLWGAPTLTLTGTGDFLCE